MFRFTCKGGIARGRAGRASVRVAVAIWAVASALRLYSRPTVVSGRYRASGRAIRGGVVSTDAFATLVVVAAVLAPLALHWLSGRTLIWLDSQRLFAPQRWIVDEAIRALRLPLWNPYLGGGTPLFADMIHGVLHPVSIVAAWLGGDRRMELLVAGHVALAGSGAALLARSLGCSRAASAGAGFAYGLSGFVLSTVGLLNLLAGAGSLPFCALGMRRAALEPRAVTLVQGVGGVLLLALSGDPQALVVGGAVGLALAWEGAAWLGVARAAAVGILGLLVAGLQLVPTLVQLSLSERGAATWSRAPEVWAFEPWRIPEIVLPGLLWGSDPLTDAVYEELAGPGRWLKGGLPIPFVASVFVGLLPLTLAIAGAREGRRGRLLGVLAMVFLWLAMGPTLGADALASRVPVWSAFRYSEKLVGPLTLAVALLAAFGLDAVAERRVSSRTLLATATLLAFASIWACRVATGRLRPEVSAEASWRVLRGAWHLMAAAGAVAGVVWLRGRVGARAIRLVLAGGVWMAMVAASPAALRPGNSRARLGSPGPRLDAKAPGPRVVTPYTYEPLSRDAGLDWLDQSARVNSAKGEVAYNVAARIDSFDFYGGMAPRRLTLLRSALGTRWSIVARRYGATHVVAAPPTTDAQRTLLAVATRDGVLVQDLDGQAKAWTVPHREWAFFAREVRTVPDEPSAIREVSRLVVDGDPAVVLEAGSRFDTAPGRVESIERGLDYVRVVAESQGDGTLVTSDAFWPGWEARIDGEPATIFPADMLVRAVRWPAGRHVLEMRYRPPEVRTGALLSVFGIAVLIFWGAWLQRKTAA